MEIKNVILEEELKNVTLEKEGNLAIITINRPKALNALNSDTLKDLDLAITNIENDSNVYCVILTGSGEKSFVAGADIAEMKDLDSKGGEEFGLLGNRVFRRLENLDKPVIAAVSGFALGGGCELAMACDIRIASEKAKEVHMNSSYLFNDRSTSLDENSEPRLFYDEFSGRFTTPLIMFELKNA